MIARQDTFSSRNEVWAALAAPLPQDVISWRQDGKPTARDGRHFARFVCYVEANTVRERLDSVVPGEWDLTLDTLPQLIGGDDSDSVCAFKARLQVLGIVREDVGTGRDYKQAATDAFKRAAVRFGIAHELYAYEQNWVELDGDGKYAKAMEDPARAYERRHGARAEQLEQSHSADAAADAGVEAATASSSITDVDSVGCPRCGGRMWDNRLTKRNPRAPDYKCRDRSCDGVVWPARTDGNATSEANEEGSTETMKVAVEPKPLRRQRVAATAGATDEIPF